MPPMIPDPITLDLGTQALAFGWTMNGSALLALGLLVVPWLLVGLAVVVELFDASVQPPEFDTAIPSPLRQAA